MNYEVVDHENDLSRVYEDKEDALKKSIDMKDSSDNVEIIETEKEPECEPEPEPDEEPADIVSGDGGDMQAQVIDHTENGHDEDTTEVSEDKTPALASKDDSKRQEVVDNIEEEPSTVNPEELSKDPIGFLQSVNSDFVNNIKGKPAISKQGFRFIQREFEISTETEVVQWIDDPTGCIVWAKAELPGGYSAEAHGEGYQFESKVDDNEFVRYADTRAKNRAISDLTSAGALAVSELGGNDA